MNGVAGQQDLVQKYSHLLSTAETRLAGLRDAQSELRRKKTALESELNALMEKIEF